MNKQSNYTCEDLKHRLNEIINFLPDATFMIDHEGKVTAWNHAMEELTNVKAEDIIGRDNHIYAMPFYGERRPILIDLALNYEEEMAKKYTNFEKNKDTLTAEVFVPNLKKEGAFLWAKACPLYDNRRDIVGAIQSIRDITPHKRVEENLKESELKLKERVKELNCLHRIIKILKNPNISIDEILSETLEQLQIVWNMPEILSAKIILDGREFSTRSYTQTPWCLSYQTHVKDKALTFDIYFPKERKFLKIDEDLIKSIAEELKAVFEFKLEWVI